MSTLRHGSDPGARFDLGDQRGETINNVGGNQNIFLPGKSIVLPSGTTGSLTTGERAAAAVGLLLFWTGLILFALAVRSTVGDMIDAQQAHALAGHYTDYVSGPWKLGLGLVVAGTVLPRLALRLLGSSAGAG